AGNKRAHAQLLCVELLAFFGLLDPECLANGATIYQLNEVRANWCKGRHSADALSPGRGSLRSKTLLIKEGQPELRPLELIRFSSGVKVLRFPWAPRKSQRTVWYFPSRSALTEDARCLAAETEGNVPGKLIG